MRRIASLVLLLAALFAPDWARAQSNPGLIYGQIPTAAQWNSYFSAKQDWLGANPCIITGCTMSGPLVTTASTALSAGLVVAPGVAPTSPVNGSIWVTISGMYVRVNGATVGPLGTGGGGGGTLVVGSTPTSGAPANGIFYNGAGNLLASSTTLPSALTYPNAVLTGTPTGAGSILTINSTNCQLAVSCSIPSGPLTVSTTIISGGTPNGLLYNAGGSPNNLIGNLATCNNGVIGTNGSGVPSCSTTLPSGLAATNLSLTTPSLGVATATKITITSASANALAVGLNGATHPALNVDASTASSATGLNIKSAAASGGLALSVISSGGNENLTINALGSGTIGIGSVSTGAVTITPATTITGALTLTGGLNTPLSLANGGTAAGLTANDGGGVYSTASAFAIVNYPGSDGLCWLSGKPPTWGSCLGAAAVASVTDSGTGTLSISPNTGAVVAAINLSNANTWLAAQTYANGMFLLAGSSSGAMTLEAPAIAGSYVVGFPASNGTVDLIGLAQTITALKTFTNSDFCILGSSTGCTTFFSANASSNNYTLTIPAVTDTMAVLGGINQIFTATETFSSVLNVTGAFQLGGNAFSTSAALAITAGTTGQLASWSSGTAINGVNIASDLTAGAGIAISGTTNATISQALNNAVLDYAFGNPSAGVGQTTALMMGMGGNCHITPVYSSRLLVITWGSGVNAAANSNYLIQQYYGTGTAPANHAALTGTAVGTQIVGGEFLAGATNPFSITNIITGLSPGTPYWLDVSLASNNTNVASLQRLTCIAIEF